MSFNIEQMKGQPGRPTARAHTRVAVISEVAPLSQQQLIEVAVALFSVVTLFTILSLSVS